MKRRLYSQEDAISSRKVGRLNIKTNVGRAAGLLLAGSVIAVSGCTLSIGEPGQDQPRDVSAVATPAEESAAPAPLNTPQSEGAFETPPGVVFQTGFNEVIAFAEPGQGLALEDLGLLTGEKSAQIGIIAPSTRSVNMVTADFFWGNMSSLVFNGSVFKSARLSAYFVVGENKYLAEMEPDCEVRGTPLQPGAARVCTATVGLPDGNAPLVRQGYWEVVTPEAGWDGSRAAFPAWEHQAPVAAGTLPESMVVPWNWDTMSPQE